VLTIFTRIPNNPHEKQCICVDAQKREVFFINGDPPFGRKARQLAVTISNFECSVLRHDVSYVDTTNVIVMPEDEWNAALAKADKNRGPLLPAVVNRIREAIRGHAQLTAYQRQLLGL
jgi:hypothetical protein